MVANKQRVSMHIPRLDVPDNIKYTPSVQHEYIHVSGHDVSLSEYELGMYLKTPDELIRVLQDGQRIMKELRAGTSAWHRYSRFNEPLRYYFIHHGIRKPMTMSPWELTSEDNDNYLTIVGNDFDSGFEPVGVRHYISLDKHEELMHQQMYNLETLIATHVTRGVEKGVSKAVEKTTISLQEIEDQKKHLAKEMAKLEKLEASIKAKAAARRSSGTASSRAGYVYLLQALHDATLFKIGRTSNPDNRAKTFGVTLPFKVEYACLIQCDDMHTLEAKLHAKFSKQRLDGEFFRLSPDDVEYIKGLAA